MDGYLAQIILWAANFAPRGWAFCWGQILSISSNQALFALLGTTYGGNGQTTFALPDLRGRVPVGTGQGPSLSEVTLGMVLGTENTTLNVSHLPAHNHAIVPSTSTLQVSTKQGNLQVPAPGSLLAASNQRDAQFISPADAGSNVVNVSGVNISGSTGVMGSGMPFTNVQPSIGLNYIICLQGIFPSRN